MPNSEPLQLPESIGKRVDPTYSKTLQARLKELLHTQNDSFPGSQPVSFESKHLTDIEREDYFVCEKSDGVRYLLFFLHSSKGPASFLFDRNKYWYYVPNLLFPVRGRENEYLKDTIMDGELVLDIDQHKKTWRYLIFDLMVVNGSTIIQRSFSTRLGMLQQDVIQPFNARMRIVQNEPSSLPPFTIELKKMERSYGLHLVFEQIPKLKHKSDGIIWTPVKYPYTSGTCEKLLKWKPPELNTVDFRIAARWSKEHKPIYSVEVLSNGVTYKFYDHFQPEPALATQWKSQLPDGRIAEFRYDSDCEVTIIEQGYAPTVRKGGWRFVRFRDDKSTANDEQVVKKILNSIQDGVTKEQLLLCMDRVRAAWKAREKGLPMPPLQTSKPTSTLSLTTSLPPTTPALSTPNSASPMLNSPSSSVTPTGYFRENVTKDGHYEPSSRSNSISEDTISSAKRKSSVSSMTTPLKEDITVEEVERKRLKAVEEEEEETTTTTATSSFIPVNTNTTAKEPLHDENPKLTASTNPVNTQAAINAPQTYNTVASSTSTTASANSTSPPIRRRKISSASDPSKKKEHMEEPDPSSSQEKGFKMRKTVPISSAKRTASAPAAVPVKQEIRGPSPQSLPQQLHQPQQQQQQPLNSSASPVVSDIDQQRTNRRSKSIPQLPKETGITPTVTKKLKPASSTNIHNLLTTTVEPTPSSPSSRAYNFSTILQRKEQQQPNEPMKTPPHIHHQLQQQQQQLHAQHQQSQMQAMHQHQQHQKRQQQLHTQQHQQQTSPVQFINFHAEGRQNSPQANNNNNHVMIIRSESNTQQPPLPSQPPPTQQKSPSSRLWKNNNVKYEGQQQRTTPPLKAAPTAAAAQPYSPYSSNNNDINNSNNPALYHHHQQQHRLPPQHQLPYQQPQQQRQDPYYENNHNNKHYGIPPPQHNNAMYSQPPSTSSSSPYGFRRSEQQVAHEYQMQKQQQLQHQHQQQQLQQQQQQQQQQQYKESQKRKNSQKAKLDFILN